jgi:shikimate dehydrogenase
MTQQFVDITVRTKLISLLGYPLAQTHAPEQFNRTFAELGLDYFYFPVETEADNLATIISAIRCMNYAGFNVTKPNKIAVLHHLDELDELAEMIGSVNVVTIRDGRLKGYNTDGPGFVDALLEKTRLDLKKTTFLVIGAGGAARAVATTIAYHEVHRILLIDAVDSMSRTLAEDINSRVRPCAEFVPFEDAPMADLLRESQVLVNAAGVGMYPRLDETPVDSTLLRPELLVVDITYNPPRTRLLREAEEAGCAVMNGVGMSINQGIRGFALMTGEPEPTAVMSRVVESIMARRQ